MAVANVAFYMQFMQYGAVCLRVTTAEFEHQLNPILP